jgi:hypothetical protein
MAAPTIAGFPPYTPLTRARPWWTPFIPTAAEFLVLALLAWTFVLSPTGLTELLSDANTGVHIRTGDLIRQTGSVPHTDPFSFSMAGQPWFAWEWLTALLYSVLHQAGGVAAVALLSLFLLGATFALTTRNMARSGGQALLILPLLFLAYRAASLHFLARPHLFTWFFLALTVALLEHDRAQRDRERPSRNIWFLVPLSILWTNLHGAFPTLPVYLALIAVGSAIEDWIGRATSTRLERPFAAARRYALLSAATAAVTVLNPYGLAVHRHIYETLTSPWLAQMVQEFMPPWTLHDERVHLFYALSALAGVSALLLLRERRFVEPIVIAFFLAASLRSARHIPLFLIAALPPMAACYSRLWMQATARASRKSTLAILDAISRDLTPKLAALSAAGPLLLAAGLAVPSHFGIPNEFPTSRFPVAMAAKHRDRLIHSRLLTHDGWADYLTYANFPDQKIWVDGRNDLFGPRYGHEYLAMMDAEPSTAALLAKWNFDTVLVRQESPLASWLAGNPSWRTVAGDDVGVLFLKR